MKKQIQILFLSIILVAINQLAYGVSAYPYPVEITQPDGSKITIILRGDEHVKWAQTIDGYSILRNSKGIYEYAILDNNNEMVPSGIQAKNQSERGSSDNQFLSKTSKGLFYSKSQVGMMKSISKMYEENPQKVFPTTGSRKLVCILIGFTDKAFSKTQTDYNNLFNQVGYATDGASGSVYDFYKENSWGQLDLTVTVAGPYTASNNMAYYGGNDVNGRDVKPRDLVTEAVNLANPDVDYADFDNDGDGTVDGVYVIYAGYGEEYSGVSTEAIWAHAWSISALTLDGKTVSRYSCSSELRGNSGTGLTRIGVICHEFGHVMGAADYYDTDYATGGSYSGTGNWDLMANGSWNNNGATPAHHNSYTKIYDYAWASATTLSSGTTASITLNNAELNSTSFYRVNTATLNEFYLIENRQQHKFDSYIPGHGMIIYHVDENYINNNARRNINAGSHQGLYPVCASATGNPPTTYGTINGGGCPFPGTGSKTSFTDATTPNALSWALVNTNKPITSITENTTDKTVSFSYIVNTTAPTAKTVAASEISPTAATLNAQVSANVASTTVTFEYGTTLSYGTEVNGTPNIVIGATPTSITAALTGLTTNTTYNFRVKAVNSVSTTYGDNMTFTTTLLTLPVTENFAASTLPAGWSTQNVGLGSNEAWVMSNTANAGGAAYELKCLSFNLRPMTTRVITPAINTVGVLSIDLSFKHFFKDYGPGATLRIQSSTDKVTWTNETWSLASVSEANIGPATVNTIITNNLNSATTYIAFVVDGDLWQIYNWYIDNVSLTITPPIAPTVTTAAVLTVSSTAASSGGNVTSDGGSTITANGVCWSTSANPTISDSKTTEVPGTGTFTSSITGLTSGTTYHVRAYATNSVETGYGADIQFTLGTVVVPTLTTTAATAITATTATSGGNLTFDGYDAITQTGVCWSTSANPTIALSTKTTDGANTGAFTSSITGLTFGTLYHVRAYATNSAGTGYGSDLTFTTPSIPTVTTTAISNIWPTTATSGGNVTSSGGATVTAKGVCWGTTANPTIALTTKTSDGTGTGTYTSYIANLAIGTTYYVRAYATNDAGTAYGSDVSFSTPGIPVVTTSTVTVTGSTTVSSGGNVTSTGGASVTVRGVCWGTTANPTVLLNSKSTNGPGTGEFTNNIYSLTAGTAYHIRAYATNSAGTAYSQDVVFTTNQTEIDNNKQVANYLGQNYPNPFDQSTTIEFTLAKPSRVKLSVFNTLGKEVEVIVDEYLPAGTYSKQWTPKGVAIGIYFYQLKADGIKETKRLVKK